MILVPLVVLILVSTAIAGIPKPPMLVLGSLQTSGELALETSVGETYARGVS